jgi:hypothetical protein
VLEHLIAPLVHRLKPPPSAPSPVELLRDMRDIAARQRPRLTPQALQRAAALIRAERIKLPANPSDIVEHLRQARAMCATTVECGDPRWEAWVTFWSLDTTNETGCYIAVPSAFRRRRDSITVDADWPPPSREVQEVATGALIPWGTPEHAAWLAHHRRQGRAEQAQAADLSKRTLTEPSRWPPVPASQGAAA